MHNHAIRTDFTYQYPPFNTLNSVAFSEVPKTEPIHIYIHIPYCFDKCKYCYFKSWAVGTDADIRIDQYIDGLLKEISLHAKRPDLENKTVRSLYIGGGTPSILNTDQLTRIVTHLKNSFDIGAEFEEFCIEGNPNDQILTLEKLECFKAIGVTRLSMGVQSFDDELLRVNGRTGSARSVRRVYCWARELGFDVINLDFISGLIGQAWDGWKRQVDLILELAPDNVALYKLEMYLNTELARQLKKRGTREVLMSDSEEAEFAHFAFEQLRSRGGYIPSNCFSLTRTKQTEHIHTLGVWNSENLLGIGLSAYGVLGNRLYQNAWTEKEYLADVMTEKFPLRRLHSISAQEKITRSMVYGIKLLRLDKKAFFRRHGFDMSLLYGDKLNRLVQDGLLIDDGVSYRVPYEQAIFADDICRNFFLPEHMTMMRAHYTRRRNPDTPEDGSRAFPDRTAKKQIQIGT